MSEVMIASANLCIWVLVHLIHDELGVFPPARLGRLPCRDCTNAGVLSTIRSNCALVYLVSLMLGHLSTVHLRDNNMGTYADTIITGVCALLNVDPAHSTLFLHGHLAFYQDAVCQGPCSDKKGNQITYLSTYSLLFLFSSFQHLVSIEHKDVAFG